MSERLSADDVDAREYRRTQRRARVRSSALFALFLGLLTAAALHAALRPMPEPRTPPSASLVP